jgi:hypothetical protein
MGIPTELRDAWVSKRQSYTPMMAASPNEKGIRASDNSTRGKFHFLNKHYEFLMRKSKCPLRSLLFTRFCCSTFYNAEAVQAGFKTAVVSGVVTAVPTVIISLNLIKYSTIDITFMHSKDLLTEHVHSTFLLCQISNKIIQNNSI